MITFVIIQMSMCKAAATAITHSNKLKALSMSFFVKVRIHETYFRVTIVKDKETRQSKGVAFVLFLDRESAHNCARAINNKQVSLSH